MLPAVVDPTPSHEPTPPPPGALDPVKATEHVTEALARAGSTAVLAAGWVQRTAPTSPLHTRYVTP